MDKYSIIYIYIYRSVKVRQISISAGMLAIDQHLSQAAKGGETCTVTASC